MNLQIGYDSSDYLVTIGEGVCIILHLYDDLIIVQPPKLRPPQGNVITNCDDNQALVLVVTTPSTIMLSLQDKFKI